VVEVKADAGQEAAPERPEGGVAIGEAARRTGLSIHTLRYYEKAGLVVTPVDRSSGGRRRYSQLDLEWVGVCTGLRTTGMPIREIRRYAELVAAGPGNERERLELLQHHRAEVITRLEEIKQNLKLIDYKIGIYQDSLTTGEANQLWSPGAPTELHGE
jgi:DNA-binding transcriptional MerR regulator